MWIKGCRYKIKQWLHYLHFKVASFGSLVKHALNDLDTPIWEVGFETGELDAWDRMHEVAFSFGLMCMLMKDNVFYYFYIFFNS